MARTGMTNLIDRLRRAVDDSGTVQVWTSDQLQTTLDLYKLRIQREELAMETTYTGAGTFVYQTYHSGYENYEEGTAYFQVEDGMGTQRGTEDYTANYATGLITMNADQGGTALYLSGWSYDINAAAADCWRERAGKVSSYYNVNLDGHNLSRAQWFEHCQQMALTFEQRSRPRVVRMWNYGVFE